MRTELSRSHEHRHCWLMDRLLFYFCWAYRLSSVSNIVVSLRYLLSFTRRVWFRNECWILLSAFSTSTVWTICISEWFQQASGQLHIGSSTVNTLRVGTVLKVIYSHSSPAKLRPYGEKRNACAPLSRCSVNTCVGASEWMHIQSLACILGRCSRFLKIWRWAGRGASPAHVH